MKKEIIPSIIANSQQELDERINKLRMGYKGETWFPLIHLDVMDGKFVKNISLNFDLKTLNAKYEAHLMLYTPEKWIEENAIKSSIIIFHIEAIKHPEKIIELIKAKGKKIGIALNPETSINKIKKYINLIDKALILTVHPGRYGSLFLSQTLDKVKQLRKLYPKLNIEVDGGINPDTIKQAKNAGANLFVVGSYLQNSSNVKDPIKKLKEQLK